VTPRQASFAAADQCPVGDVGHRDLVNHSIELITAQQAASGAYPACPSYPVYRFAWLRDGAFTAEGLSRHAEIASAEAFHDWVATTITDRRDRIQDIVHRLAAGITVADQEYLPARYTLDGRESDEHWWNFQLDGYGTWLWALATHVRRHRTDPARYLDAVDLTAGYLAAAWQQPCYDWWEENLDQVHVATLTAIDAGLGAALDLGLPEATAPTVAAARDRIHDVVTGPGCVDGRLRKWLGADGIDASALAATGPFAVVDLDVAARTVRAVERDLVEDRGVHRYAADTFYGGGRWPILAGLLGQTYARLGRLEDARRQLDWICRTADDSMTIPEQVSDRLLALERFAEWVDRWGPVARPLLWSHGEYLALAASLGIHR
jgi:GH15 family glucan-1,4-alpha-glucosidase